MSGDRVDAGWPEQVVFTKDELFDLLEKVEVVYFELERRVDPLALEVLDVRAALLGKLLGDG